MHNPEASLAGEDKRRYVVQMFSRIAGRYDLLNTLMTFGRDDGWRKLTARVAAPAMGQPALDMATGTGKIAVELARRGALAVGLDLTLDMMTQGRSDLEADLELEALAPRVTFVGGDALVLPFADNTFSCATSGFALRNVTDVPRALAELCRVVRPGGRVVILEASQPPSPLIRSGNRLYTRLAIPLLGLLIAGDADAYTYLPSSMARFPGAPKLAAMMRAAGMVNVRYKRLMLGSAAIHVGMKRGA